MLASKFYLQAFFLNMNLYINLFLFLLLAFIPIKSNHQKIAIIIDKSSNIVVKGSSNVNKFECEYEFKDENIYSFQNYTTDIKLKIEKLIIKIPTAECDCGNFFLNSDFQSTLNAKKHPQIIINIPSLEIEKLKSEKQGYIGAELEIAGVKNNEKLKYSANYNTIDQSYLVEGNVKIHIKDYNIEVKNRYFGFIKVDDEVEIYFLFKFVPKL